MAKVEGSNPFIRLQRKPCKVRGFSRFWRELPWLARHVGSARG
jgi:hypothetical protein